MNLIISEIQLTNITIIEHDHEKLSQWKLDLHECRNKRENLMYVVYKLNNTWFINIPQYNMNIDESGDRKCAFTNFIP